MTAEKQARKKPQQKAIDHTRECAQRGGGAECCPYKSKAWESVWLAALMREKQLAFILEVRTSE